MVMLSQFLKEWLPLGLLLSLLLGTAAGCSGKLDRAEYMAWVEDYGNGLHVQKTVGAYRVDVQYKPAPYQALLEQGVQTTLVHLDTTAEMQYYTLTLGLADGKGDFVAFGVDDYETQQRKLYYFSYLFQEDIFIEEGGKKLPCLLYHFERSYDLKPSRTCMLAFESPSRGTMPCRLVIHSPWLGDEPISLAITQKKTPTLNL
jgi:hypothetical protein